jgi:gamma-glutamyltranspeptidase/glutathione hydrolase
VQPALRLAEEGFAVDPRLAKEIAENAPRFNGAAREAFLPDGRPPAVGERLRQPDLARTLAALAGSGPDALYAGALAESLAAGVRAAGGVLTTADLAAYRAVWREPLRGRYRGLDVWTVPPPSSGGVALLEMLNVLSGFDLAAAGHGGAVASHLLIEAMKLAFADRGRWLGDPDFVAVPAARLASPAYADSLRGLISPAAALPWRALGDTSLAAPGRAGAGHTSHLSVVDAEGGAVALTSTINLGFGSGLVAPGTGVVLNDEMDDFALAPGVPNAFGLVGGEANAVAPGKRPLSSMTPTILTRDGEVALVLGSPGGSRIITAVLQTLVNVVDFGLPLARAVGAPRLHQQWQPPETDAEPLALSPDTAALLRARGHAFRPREAVGNVQAIRVDPATGRREGASDPRGAGAAAGY